jgi:hypothetical protein
MREGALEIRLNRARVLKSRNYLAPKQVPVGYGRSTLKQARWEKIMQKLKGMMKRKKVRERKKRHGGNNHRLPVVVVVRRMEQ